MATALSASLELGSALEATREAERLRAAALLGAAGLRTNDEVLDTLVALRDGLGALRKGAVSERSAEAFGRLTLPLAGALARSRALAALALGAPMREVLEVAEVLADLSDKDADVRTPCPAASVAGDPTLLRLGLLAMLSAAGGRQVEAARGQLQRQDPGGARPSRRRPRPPATSRSPSTLRSRRRWRTSTAAATAVSTCRARREIGFLPLPRH